MLEHIAVLLGGFGLIVRGGFNFREYDVAVNGPGGKPGRSAVLAGHGGGGFWPKFEAWLQGQEPVPDNPLDTWSRHVIDGVARQCDARAVYPSDIPYLPFQQWAMRAEGLSPSPLGLLMHPEFGLWHAYRGALIFDREFDFQAVENVIHLCERCDGKPCLNSCPAGAFSDSGYAVHDCRSHVASASGTDCRDSGCLARKACPFGLEHRYSNRQQAFHMAAFLRG